MRVSVATEPLKNALSRLLSI